MPFVETSCVVVLFKYYFAAFGSMDMLQRKELLDFQVILWFPYNGLMIFPHLSGCVCIGIWKLWKGVSLTYGYMLSHDSYQLFAKHLVLH